MVPRAVLIKSGLVSIDTARQVNTAHTKTTVNGDSPMSIFSKIAYSTVKRPINKNTTFKNSNSNQRVNTVRGNNVNTARPKAVVNTVKGNNVNAVKASSCWVWKPKQKVLDHVSKHNSASIILKKFDYGNPQMDLQDKGVIDSGFSRHMTGNVSYLTDFKEIDRGYVAFGGSGPDWLFDIDALTKSMNYKPVRSPHAGFKPLSDDGKEVDEDSRKDSECIDQKKENNVNITKNVNAANTNEVNAVCGKTSIELPDDPNMTPLEDIVYSYDDEDVGVEADMKNSNAFMPVSSIPTTRVHKDHPVEQIIGDFEFCTSNTIRKWTKKFGRNMMDVKSAFLYGKIKEEVYVCQPPGFEDPYFPDSVYKVENALYGLHQDPRAWYETLSTYLLDNGFQRGKIDKTLFIKRDKGDILLVQVYVDDIIFGSTKKSLCTEFEKMMHKKFQMSSMGELTFFLGLQVKQKEDGICISQDKFVIEILKKFGFTDVRTVSTPMETQKLLLKNEDGEEVDVHLYRSMIGSLMYLTSSRPNIMFAMCACARYHVNLKVSHLYAVKRIFRYLKGQPKLGLWYPKDSPFDLIAYTDSDYVGSSLDRKYTTGGCQFLGSRLISWQCKKQTVVANSITEAEYVAASSCCGQVL
ncbi:putative ribonuclease H-like domain-containing protein [Tanacetum coccineum]